MTTLLGLFALCTEHTFSFFKLKLVQKFNKKKEAKERKRNTSRQYSVGETRYKGGLARWQQKKSAKRESWHY